MLQQPIARLAIAAGAIIILIVVITLLVRDCQRSQLVDSYRSYVVEGVTPIATQTKKQGEDLIALLQNQRGRKADALQKDARGIANRARALVTAARDLNPPDDLGEADRMLQLALAFRANGMETLAEEIPNVITSRDAAEASTRIQRTMERILASDVIYADSFVGPARQALEADNIDGVEVPAAAILSGTTNARFVAPAGARVVWNNLRRGTAAGTGTTDDAVAPGLHGTGIVSVKVGGKTLVNGTVNEITASENNEWEVTVENGGNFVENGIKVTAELRQEGGAPERNTATIPTIDPKEPATVKLPVGTPEFTVLGQVVITVDKVPGEVRTGNNEVRYSVRFVIQ